MKWLSLGEHYAHEVVGGTELYVHRLHVALHRRGVDAVGAYFTERPGRSTFEGVPLIGLAMPPRPASRMAAWECVPHGIEKFRELLAEVQPDVVHFHAPLRIHPPEYFEMARSAGARTLWTFHAPGQTCLQTALLRNGHIPCDGRIDASRCARCGLIWSGLPLPVAALFGALDLYAVAPFVPARLTHPFERRHGIARFRARLEQACDSLDHWVTHSRWTRELLELNQLRGAPGLDLPLPPPLSNSVEPDPSPWEGLPHGLRLLYAGRLLDIKGPELLLQALGGPLRGEDIGLALLAPLVGSSFEAHVRSLVDAEPRARLLPPRDPIGTLAAMASADAVVVPSIWKETGPYTVIEAQWTGAPVIGSNLAGILERLESDPSSELFQTNDVDDLACAIRRSRERMDGDAARQKRARDFRERYADSFEVALGRVLDTVLKKA